jgi:hypothetical protein
MRIEIGLTEELTNTQFAPLAALFAHYQQNNQLEALRNLEIPMRQRDLKPGEKLVQVLISILAGCRTLSEVNGKLKPEVSLAKALGWSSFADQSTLSRTLDALSLQQTAEMRAGITAIRQSHSPLAMRDWRSFLWLDFDLTGLPCGAKAEASQKGYFGDKKMPGDGSWLA